MAQITHLTKAVIDLDENSIEKNFCLKQDRQIFPSVNKVSVYLNIEKRGMIIGLHSSKVNLNVKTNHQYSS